MKKHIDNQKFIQELQHILDNLDSVKQNILHIFVEEEGVDFYKSKSRFLEKEKMKDAVTQWIRTAEYDIETEYSGMEYTITITVTNGDVITHTFEASNY